MIGGIMIGSGIFYLGARTGLMSHGYVDDADNHGLEWISTEDMDRCCQLAKEHNLQVITHCIGDEAVRRTVECYERAFTPTPSAPFCARACTCPTAPTAR